MFSKILVANRGEIAIRAFRAAYELGVADRGGLPLRGPQLRCTGSRPTRRTRSASRGTRSGPTSTPRLIVEAAVKAGADAIYPGYGFLSENPALAEACADAGITFVGPGAGVLDPAGNKVARDRRRPGGGRPDAAERRARAPTSTRWSQEAADARLPGLREGGRRRRRPRHAPGRGAGRAARGARGRDARGGGGVRRPDRLHRAGRASSPRHIEVQILADADGDVIHLYERDCSVQRRHQKVVEIAPAPNLDAGLRARICADAVRFAREIGYVNAGTVEFLVDPAGSYVFIEMNPRIQVEHTVTEEITDVDLVQAQLRIAAGETLADLGLVAGRHPRSAAPRCSAGSRPRTRPTTSARTPAGSPPTARRAARASASTAAPPTPAPRSRAHFDSLLAKLTCRGRTFEAAVDRARRALAEFRIRGVATNIPFLQAVLDDPDFRAGRPAPPASSRSTRSCSRPRSSADRGTKLLTYLADVTVNQPYGARPGQRSTRSASCRTIDLRQPPPGRVAPAPARARAGRVRRGSCAPRRAVAVTDTTFRDAHQSLLATRVRTRDLLERRRPRRPDHARAALARGLGRRDLRRRAALPRARTRGSGWPTSARPSRTSACRCCCAAATRSATRPTRTAVTRGVRRGGGGDRHRHLPHLRRAQRRQPDAAGHRRRPRDRHGRRRGRALLHRRPARPGRAALHPRLLPAPGRADRRRRRARPGDQGHGGPAARRRPRSTLVTRAARAVRPAGPPAHPRHRRRPARDPARRHRGRGRRGRRRQRGRCPARPASRRCRRWSPPPTTPTARHRPVAAGRVRPRALLGGRAPPLRAVRVRACPRRPAASTATRSPAASSPTCASRRSRSASATSSSRSRTCTPPPTASSATSSRSPRAARSSATWRCTWSPSAPTRGDFADDPGQVRHPRLRDRLPRPASSATRPAAGPSRSAPRSWPAATAARARHRAHRRRSEDGLRTDRRRTLDRLLFPGPTRQFEESRATYGDLSVARHRRLPLRAAARARSTASPSKRARLCCSASSRSASPTSAASAPSCARSTASSARSPSATARSSPTRPPPRRPTRPGPGTSPPRSAAA